MSLVSAFDLMKQLEIAGRKIKWVKCPFCDDEVTKLRPCIYWQDGKQMDTHACVECAECVKGLTYLANLYPIAGVDVVPELMPAYKKLSSKYISEHSYKANVTYGSWSFTVYRKGGRLAVYETKKTPEDEKTYDNTFQVWFALKSEFEKVPEETVSKKMWGHLILILGVFIR